MSDPRLEDTVHLMFTSRQFSNGVPTAISGGVVDIYEDATATPIVTGETFVASLNSVVGLNVITVTATAATGFNANGTYNAVMQAGTVGGDSIIGEVVGTFTIEKDCTNWAKVAAPTTANDLSATDIQLCDTTTVNTDVTALNDVAATDIVSAGAITTLSGAIVNVDLVDLCTTTTTNTDVTALNDVAATDIVSAGAITTLSGAIVNVDLCDLTTTTTTATNLTTNNDKTAYVLSTTGLDAIAAASAGMVQIAKAVWDRVLNVANHNILDSAGRRVRALQEAGAYTFGHVFIDGTNGAAGTTDFENGVEINPVLAIGDANTIATSVGLSRFAIAPATSITFVASQDNQEFEGENWTLVLGSQSVSGSHFLGADVSGTGTGASEIHFEHCEIGTMTIAGAHFDNCDIEDIVTLSAASTYVFAECLNSGTAVIDFGTGALNTTVFMRHFKGDIEIRNMGQMSSTDVLHFDSPGGQLTLASTCIAGTINIRGVFELVDNSSGTTINRGGDIINDNATTSEILTQVNTALDAAISELTQGVPTATPSVRTGIMLMYMALRNQLDVQTSGTDALEIHNNAGTQIAIKLLTDDGSDYSEAQMTTGV